MDYDFSQLDTDTIRYILDNHLYGQNNLFKDALETELAKRFKIEVYDYPGC